MRHDDICPQSPDYSHAVKPAKVIVNKSCDNDSITTLGHCIFCNRGFKKFEMFAKGVVSAWVASGYGRIQCVVTNDLQMTRYHNTQT